MERGMLANQRRRIIFQVLNYMGIDKTMLDIRVESVIT